MVKHVCTISLDLSRTSTAVLIFIPSYTAGEMLHNYGEEEPVAYR